MSITNGVFGFKWAAGKSNVDNSFNSNGASRFSVTWMCIRIAVRCAVLHRKIPQAGWSWFWPEITFGVSWIVNRPDQLFWLRRWFDQDKVTPAKFCDQYFAVATSKKRKIIPYQHNTESLLQLDLWRIISFYFYVTMIELEGQTFLTKMFEVNFVSTKLCFFSNVERIRSRCEVQSPKIVSRRCSFRRQVLCVQRNRYAFTLQRVIIIELCAMQVETTRFTSTKIRFWNVKILTILHYISFADLNHAQVFTSLKALKISIGRDSCKVRCTNYSFYFHSPRIM